MHEANRSSATSQLVTHHPSGNAYQNSFDSLTAYSNKSRFHLIRASAPQVNVPGTKALLQNEICRKLADGGVIEIERLRMLPTFAGIKRQADHPATHLRLKYRRQIQSKNHGSADDFTSDLNLSETLVADMLRKYRSPCCSGYSYLAERTRGPEIWK